MLMRAANVVQQLCNDFEVLSFIVSFIVVVISLLSADLRPVWCEVANAISAKADLSRRSCGCNSASTVDRERECVLCCGG